MTLEKLRKQVLWWNKAAILAPILVTSFLGLLYWAAICPPEDLFVVLQQMNHDLVDATVALKGIRDELQVDNQDDN